MLEAKNEDEKEEYRKYCDKYFLQSSYIAELYKDYNVQKVIDQKRDLWNI